MEKTVSTLFGILAYLMNPSTKYVRIADWDKVNWSANIVDHRYHQNIRAQKLREAKYE